MAQANVGADYDSISSSGAIEHTWVCQHVDLLTDGEINGASEQFTIPVEDLSAELSCICVCGWAAPDGEHDGKDSWRTLRVGEECLVFTSLPTLIEAQKTQMCVLGLPTSGRPAGWFPATCVAVTPSSVEVIPLNVDNGAAEHAQLTALEETREGLLCVCVRNWAPVGEHDGTDSWRSVHVHEDYCVFTTLSELIEAQESALCVLGLPTNGRPAGWFPAKCVKAIPLRSNSGVPEQSEHQPLPSSSCLCREEDEWIDTASTYAALSVLVGDRPVNLPFDITDHNRFPWTRWIWMATLTGLTLHRQDVSKVELTAAWRDCIHLKFTRSDHDTVTVALLDRSDSDVSAFIVAECF